ncbi:MAG: hypothetical protein IJH36_05125, partial [Clostridia bacterium]|nr:hypothetical protein [Clostridia bacterium]
NAFDVVALAAGELGYDEDKTDMESRARALKTAINTKLQNSEGLYVDGTKDANGTQSSHISQHANSFALAYGIATDENKQAVADYIAGLGMKQGPMTADILAKALFNAGENTAALRLFTEPHDYGWAREVANGYTFTFESWEADSLANEDSQSHAWGSTAASDILKNFAGVTVTKAGASEVKIAPVYVDLTSLDAQVSTERGKVGVSYRRTSSSFDITITVPANMKANIVLPDVGEGTYKRNGVAVERTMTVGSGTYAFTFDGTIVPPEEVVYKTPAENGIKGTNNAQTNTYTYEIGNSTDKKSSYSDESDYVNLTVGLGTGDSLNEDSGIIFGGTAVPDSGGVDTTGRYLLVEPKRSGTFTLYATCTGSNNRIYYYNYGTGAVDLSAATKSGTVAANGITKNVKTKAEITMTADNKYVIYPYTYGGSSIISDLSYAYTDEEITSDTEYEAPDAAKTVTEPSGTSITLDHNTYPLVVGNASATDFTDWETRGSSFTLTAAVDSNDYT